MRRFSGWFALFGLVFLFAGMLGTARQFKQLQLLKEEPLPEGFLPITVDIAEPGGRMAFAPGLSEAAVSQLPSQRPAATPQPTQTPFTPGEYIEPDYMKVDLPARPARPQAFLPSVYGGEGAGLEVGVALQEASGTAGEAYPAPGQAAPGQAAPTQAAAESAGPEPVQEPLQQPVETEEPPALSEPAAPDWIEIPSIGLDAPVTVVSPVQVSMRGKAYEQWTAPNLAAAGWHDRSARLGEDGNVVLNGHHNIYGSVFANLNDLQPGDEIRLYVGGVPFRYVVAQTMILDERNASFEQRQDNARWILPSNDRRLTLVTCWPANSNTHRLIVVASP